VLRLHSIHGTPSTTFENVTQRSQINNNKKQIIEHIHMVQYNGELHFW
jgi:hypothetical protein